mmetsp:Transcript_32293/g.95138  ORF Transcript_32293/g.95138 Transcript_32293/m.95138 type:complete len:387 (-) Transcript_32293:657-1817(-)
MGHWQRISGTRGSGVLNGNGLGERRHRESQLGRTGRFRRRLHLASCCRCLRRLLLCRGSSRCRCRCGETCLGSCFGRVVKAALAATIFHVFVIVVFPTTTAVEPFLDVHRRRSSFIPFHGGGRFFMCIGLRRGSVLSTSAAHTAGGYIGIRPLLDPISTTKDEHSTQIVIAAVVALGAAPQLGRGSEERYHPVGGSCGRRGRGRCRCFFRRRRCMARAMAAAAAAWGCQTVVVKAAHIAQHTRTTGAVASSSNPRIGRSAGRGLDRQADEPRRCGGRSPSRIGVRVRVAILVRKILIVVFFRIVECACSRCRRSAAPAAAATSAEVVGPFPIDVIVSRPSLRLYLLLLLLMIAHRRCGSCSSWLVPILALTPQQQLLRTRLHRRRC